ncbi:NHL repeat-containing protein [Marinimicrobium koreense]|uniref:NHL repeat-containing protein n=1 Tax=Marinimicrobium koreense TaxID=306545 RepID=A0A3N1NZ07_9GAMM|nr:NHL repeat-containing protein [Marinimicrobium koreense]ROQ21415.1 NHL repeat-containing protein [Marinimicrobium koreense]
MIRLGRWLGYGLLAILVLLALFLGAGGAINWNQEPPYELVQSWGKKGEGPAEFDSPTGIAVTAEEVFIADARNSRIQVLDKKGKFLRDFGAENLGRPMNITIANDKLYVPDYLNDVVHVFTLAGEHERAIEAEDGLDSPGGVAVRADGTLLIADSYGQRIVHITPDGEVLESWGGAGRGPGEFSYPADVALAPDGGFYVADGYNDRVQQFGPDGTFIRKWGGPFGMNIFGPFRGWFTTATSIDVAPDGTVFVADFYNDRIQKFTAEGDFLTAFGTASEGPGHSEMAVAIDAEGRVWTTHFAGHQVEVWRPAD